jgi:hypothetical protein
VLAAQLGRTSPEARQTWLVVVLVSAQVVPLAFRQASLEQGKQLAPSWLVMQRTSLEVVLAEPVWLAVQQISPEVARALLEQQLAPVDYDSAGRLPQSVAAPEQGERESLGQLVFRQQSA